MERREELKVQIEALKAEEGEYVRQGHFKGIK
jgi:hypothetical protein